MKIFSNQNTKVKEIIKLQQKSRERKKLGLFVVEGIQENILALKNEFSPVSFFVYDDLFKDALKLNKTDIFHISKEIFDKIAYRKTTGGIVGVYRTKEFDIKTLKRDNLLLVVLESVEKPGNLGAILRTCDAAKVDAVIVCDAKVDFFNPNVIRSSVGTIFTQKIINLDKNDVLSFCENNEIQILSTFLREDTHDIYTVNLTPSTALVFGTEAEGLSNFWHEKATKTIKIPMNGQVDSLNVSNAVAVSVFESYRQRNSC